MSPRLGKMGNSRGNGANFAVWAELRWPAGDGRDMSPPSQGEEAGESQGPQHRHLMREKTTRSGGGGHRKQERFPVWMRSSGDPRL